MRSNATRRARYGTVVMPTKAAMISAADARILDDQTLPASLAMLENSAAANAKRSPASARKKRSHTSPPLVSQKRQDGRLADTADLTALAMSSFGSLKGRVALGGGGLNRGGWQIRQPGMRRAGSFYVATTSK